jgi:hypothetical protein
VRRVITQLYYIKRWKFFKIEDEAACGFVCIILMYCGECCVWFDGCVHVFLCVSNLEFLVERWDRCGQVMEGVVNALLLAMLFLLLIIYCDGTSVKMK